MTRAFMCAPNAIFHKLTTDSMLADLAQKQHHQVLYLQQVLACLSP